ncbi:MAG TPA: response regulator [Planctomycetaceae bacterium]|nr:response regulator [Planctomycetaceae bacterium]
MTKSHVNFLLVEDDDTHAHLVMRSLKKARVTNRVFRVKDGLEAISFLHREEKHADSPRPDVVLLDLKLPKMDGHEVLAEIKRDPDLRLIPVVIMTTSDAESDRELAYEHHANSYVVKPADFDKLCKLVDDLSLYWSVWNESPFGE